MEGELTDQSGWQLLSFLELPKRPIKLDIKMRYNEAHSPLIEGSLHIVGTCVAQWVKSPSSFQAVISRFMS